MEHLEKHLYNAYEGAAVAMPALPKVCLMSMKIKLLIHAEKYTYEQLTKKNNMEALTNHFYNHLVIHVIIYSFIFMNSIDKRLLKVCQFVKETETKLK